MLQKLIDRQPLEMMRQKPLSEDIPWTELAFDHALVLKDYLEWKNGNRSIAMPKP